MAHAWKACWVHALAGSNPASSAAVIRANAEADLSRRRSRPGIVSIVVSIGIVDTVSLRPQQAADPVGHITPDRIRHVLIARRHRRARPPHDAHYCPLGHAQNEQNGRRRVPRVMQPAIGYAGRLKERLPLPIVRVETQRICPAPRRTPSRLPAIAGGPWSSARPGLIDEPGAAALAHQGGPRPVGRPATSPRRPPDSALCVWGTSRPCVRRSPACVLIDRAWPRASDPQRPCLEVHVVPAQARLLPLPQSESERDRPACAVRPLHRCIQDPVHLID